MLHSYNELTTRGIILQRQYYKVDDKFQICWFDVTGRWGRGWGKCILAKAIYKLEWCFDKKLDQIRLDFVNKFKNILRSCIQYLDLALV